MIARPDRPARTVDVVSIAALALAEILAMTLWFMATTLLPEMRAETPLPAWQAGALATSVQAASHLIAWGGGHGWRSSTLIASGLAVAAAGLMAAVRLGPFHQCAPGFSFAALALAWRDRRLRLAYAGYLGHMWELYAFWAWIGSVLALSLAEGKARLTAFAVIAVGGLACLPAGYLADRIGKAQVARAAMLMSALAGVATAASLGGPAGLTILAAMVWGTSVVPDSAQFSALVADAAPTERAGSLMTLQTAIGFLFAALSVQLLPLIAAAAGWPVALLVLLPGPLLGVLAMTHLIALQRDAVAA